jgi:hypothetical protein
VDGTDGLGDGRGKQGDRGPGRRGGGRPGGAVEADDGVEVDHAAALVFGDLGEGDPQLGGEGLVRQPGLASKGAAQGDGEAAPQFGGAGVEQDRAGVVIAVRAQRLTEPGIIASVPVTAGHTSAVGAGLDAPTRAAALELAVFLAGQVAAAGLLVIECEQPRRAQRRGKGKSDPIDAHLAVLAALRLDTGRLPVPRADGDREALRILLVARQEITVACTAQASRLRALLLAGDDTDRRAARRVLSKTALAALAGRELPRCCQP